MPPVMSKKEKKAANAALAGSQASAQVMYHPSSGGMSPYVRMLADPLSAELVGRPDDNTAQTNVVRIVDVYDIATDANGNAVWQFSSTSQNKAMQYTLATTTPFAATATSWQASQYDTQLGTDNCFHRPLIYVLEWKPTVAVNVMQGKLALPQYNNGGPAKNIALYFNDNGVHGPASEQAVVIGRHYTAPLFSSSRASSQLNNTMLVIAGGPPNTSVVGQVILTQIIEVVPNQSVLSASSARHTPCDMMACCAAANVFGPAVSGAQGSKPYEQVSSKALKLALTASKLFPSPTVQALAGLVSQFMH